MDFESDPELKEYDFLYDVPLEECVRLFGFHEEEEGEEWLNLDPPCSPLPPRVIEDSPVKFEAPKPEAQSSKTESWNDLETLKKVQFSLPARRSGVSNTPLSVEVAPATTTSMPVKKAKVKAVKSDPYSPASSRVQQMIIPKGVAPTSYCPPIASGHGNNPSTITAEQRHTTSPLRMPVLPLRPDIVHRQAQMQHPMPVPMVDPNRYLVKKKMPRPQHPPSRPQMPYTLQPDAINHSNHRQPSILQHVPARPYAVNRQHPYANGNSQGARRITHSRQPVRRAPVVAHAPQPTAHHPLPLPHPMQQSAAPPPQIIYQMPDGRYVVPSTVYVYADGTPVQQVMYDNAPQVHQLYRRQ